MKRTASGGSATAGLGLLRLQVRDSAEFGCPDRTLPGLRPADLAQLHSQVAENLGCEDKIRLEVWNAARRRWVVPATLADVPLAAVVRV